MKTLYVTDLDGTLLNRQDRLSETTSSIINDLVARGMHFTYATARSPASAFPVTQGLSTHIPAITYNGTLIVEPDSGKRLVSITFSEEEVLTMQALMDHFGLDPFVYTYVNDVEQVRWHAGQENEGSLRYLNNRTGDERLTPLSTGEPLYVGTPFYFTCIGEQRDLRPLYEALQADPRFYCTLQQELYRPEYWLDILSSRATKANAIQTLRTLWGCDRVVCFGDAINDLPMFSVSDECYAVSNAVPELQAAATGVIGSNDEDAVAHWLATYAQLDE